VKIRVLQFRKGTSGELRYVGDIDRDLKTVDIQQFRRASALVSGPLRTVKVFCIDLYANDDDWSVTKGDHGWEIALSSDDPLPRDLLGCLHCGRPF
jgi:hypothetical protein